MSGHHQSEVVVIAHTAFGRCANRRRPQATLVLLTIAAKLVR
jgi:hypothetical protein